MFRFIKNHWLAAAGSALLVLSQMYHVVRFVLDMAGYADFLIGHANATDPTWVTSVKNVLFQPPEWAQILLIFLGLAAIWWDTRRLHQARARPEQVSISGGSGPLPNTESRSFAPPTNTESPIAEAERATDTSTSKPMFGGIGDVVYQEPWEDKIDLGKLFVVENERGRLMLRFSPDTQRPRPDGVLLTAFAYKKLYGKTDITKAEASTGISSVSFTNHEQPMIALMMAGLASRYNETVSDMVRNHLSGSITMVKLSEGGRLAITSSGYRTAYYLARDLIARA